MNQQRRKTMKSSLEYGVTMFRSGLTKALYKSFLSSYQLNRSELETAHAFSVLPKLNLKPTDVVVVCLSGRGDKDLATYMQYL